MIHELITKKILRNNVKVDSNILFQNSAKIYNVSENSVNIIEIDHDSQVPYSLFSVENRLVWSNYV